MLTKYLLPNIFYLAFKFICEKNNHFRKRMTAMYVNPTSVAFQKKKDFHSFMCEKFCFLFISIKRNIHYCHYLASYEDVTMEDVTSP